MSEPLPLLQSIAYAIEAIETRLDAHPEATVTPSLRAALDCLLALPAGSPLPDLQEYEPEFLAAVEASWVAFGRNLWVMENFVLALVSECEAAGAGLTDVAWMESLHASMLGYLRLWFGAYSREICPDGIPAEIEDWSLCRLAAAYQTAYAVDPNLLPYRPLPPAELVALSADLI